MSRISWGTKAYRVQKSIFTLKGSSAKMESMMNSAVKVATTPEEIAALLEIGFEYVMTKEGLAYFRKRK